MAQKNIGISLLARNRSPKNREVALKEAFTDRTRTNMGDCEPKTVAPSELLSKSAKQKIAHVQSLKRKLSETKEELEVERKRLVDDEQQHFDRAVLAHIDVYEKDAVARLVREQRQLDEAREAVVRLGKSMIAVRRKIDAARLWRCNLEHNGHLLEAEHEGAPRQCRHCHCTAGQAEEAREMMQNHFPTLKKAIEQHEACLLIADATQT